MFYEQSTWHQVGTTLTYVSYCHTDLRLVKVPKPGPEEEEEEKPGDNPEIPMPQTLVRIPIESQSDVLRSQNGTGKSSEA